jgi:predicted urease superfamily metal-dependent hydrolase
LIGHQGFTEILTDSSGFKNAQVVYHHSDPQVGSLSRAGKAPGLGALSPTPGFQIFHTRGAS